MKTTYFAPSGGISKIACDIPFHHYFKNSRKIIESPINIDVPNGNSTEIKLKDFVVPIVVAAVIVGTFCYLEHKRKEDDNR